MAQVVMKMSPLHATVIIYTILLIMYMMYSISGQSIMRSKRLVIKYIPYRSDQSSWLLVKFLSDLVPEQFMDVEVLILNMVSH